MAKHPSRKECISTPMCMVGCQFVVTPNKDADGAEPIYEIAAFSDVNRYGSIIDEVSKKTGTDARLIRAIMYMETTHGYYDAPMSLFGKNKSILPMNINADYWGDTFGSRDSLKKPNNNIKAGAEMLIRIRSYLPQGATIAQIATLYNNINANQVSNYGARVQKIYEKQPWLKN